MNIIQRLCLIVLLAAIPVGVLQGFNLRDRYLHESEDVSDEALHLALRVGAEQRRVMENARQMLTIVSHLDPVRNRDADQCGAALKRLQAQLPIYLGIGVADPNGTVWCSHSTPGIDVSDRDHFKSAIATGEFTIGGYVRGRVSGRPAFTFSQPFYHATGELAGVVMAGMDLALLARDLGRGALPPDTNMVIAGPNRRILVDLPGNERVGAILPHAFHASVLSGEARTMAMRWLDGRERLVGFVPPGVEPGGPFLIAVGVDRSRALDPVVWRGLTGIATLLLTVGVALALGWWSAMRFVRLPVRHLVSTMGAWLGGADDTRAGRLDPGSEFDDLARAFDAMADTLDERQRRLRAALENTTDSVLTIGPDWIVTFLNERACRKLNGASLMGQDIRAYIPVLGHGPAADRLEQAMAHSCPTVVDFDYEPLSARLEANAFPTPHGGLTIFLRDVTEQHRAREELRHQALHDSLTGLPNRANAMGMAVTKLVQKRLTAFILIDLDGFKHINDSFGHLAGDSMLRAVAGRLTECVDGDTIVARLGGDEFLALMFDAPAHACPDFAEKIVETVGREPFLVRGRLHPITASCGLAMVRGAADETVEELLVNADLALYRAKAAGGGTCRMYSAADRGAYEARRLLEDEITRAVRANEFELHFQPQVRLEDGECVGAEALIRWRHPQRGLLGPAAFLDVLEHSRHVVTVGAWVLDEACREAAKWWRTGRQLRVGVNLFAEQLRSADLPTIVQQTLARHGLPPQALELELTENIALAHEEAITTKLLALRALGVGLAFDDFGTGFASLTTLKHVPVTRLKIDRGFVAALPSDEHDAAIVEAVLALARTLDLEVIAEGVETAAQEDYLRARGCQEAQGFRYGKAMTAAGFRAHIPRVQDSALAG